MSVPEHIEDRTTGTGPAGTALANEPHDIIAAVGQLRVLVCGLGAGLLIVSVALTAFVFKENRDLAATTVARQRQISELQPSVQSLGYVVDQLARYSFNKPELAAIFTRHGVRLNAGSQDGQPTSPLR
jgi:hypothetical protein